MVRFCSPEPGSGSESSYSNDLNIFVLRLTDLKHDDGGELPGERGGVDVILGGDVGEPAHVHLAEPQVGQRVVVRQLREDVGKVDACRGPGRIEGHQPRHLQAIEQSLYEQYYPTG